MAHIQMAEDKMFIQKIQRKLLQVDAKAQTYLDRVWDHVDFTLQQAYYKCAHECFDRRRNKGEINNCVEHCGVPVVSAKVLIQKEMAEFHEGLHNSVKACQDKFHKDKFRMIRAEARSTQESCIDQSIQESISTLPDLVRKIMSSLSKISDGKVN